MTVHLYQLKCSKSSSINITRPKRIVLFSYEKYHRDKRKRGFFKLFRSKILDFSRNVSNPQLNFRIYTVKKILYLKIILVKMFVLIF